MIVEIPDGKPRNQCRGWLADQREPGVLLNRAEFDRLAKARSFAVGPFRDTFGDGWDHPYNPHRQAFGRLDDGRCVYCELTGGPAQGEED